MSCPVHLCSRLGLPSTGWCENGSRNPLSCRIGKRCLWRGVLCPTVRFGSSPAGWKPSIMHVAAHLLEHALGDDGDGIETFSENSSHPYVVGSEWTQRPLTYGRRCRACSRSEVMKNRRSGERMSVTIPMTIVGDREAVVRDLFSQLRGEIDESHASPIAPVPEEALRRVNIIDLWHFPKHLQRPPLQLVVDLFFSRQQDQDPRNRAFPPQRSTTATARIRLIALPGECCIQPSNGGSFESTQS
jgi:hypothetical protein